MKRIFAAILAFAMFSQAYAGPIDDARRLYRSGKYAAAIEYARKVVKRTPRDGNGNFFLGASLYKLGRFDEALAPLRQAESRGVAEASQMLTEYYMKHYNVDKAEEHLDSWAEILQKGKKSLPKGYDYLSSQLVKLRNMLGRVERLEIVDSLSVDSARFFDAIRLSPQAGRILPPESVGSIGAMAASELSTGYMPENNSEILWSASDSNGRFELYGAGILDDGTLDHPTALSGNLGEGGDARYPFLMPDGVTLYFANNGENSLGGYDIFLTRRTDDGYFVPQNMGMPYNSPDNDYMLAIDETSGLGWLVTDRNHVPGKLTVYVFLPSAMRVNADPDDVNLEALARLSDISLSRNPDTDYSALLASKLPDDGSDDGSRVNNSSPRFMIDMGNGKIYTSLNQFRNKNARSAMIEYLNGQVQLRRLLASQSILRDKYSKGDRSVAQTILDNEDSTAHLRKELINLRNKAISLETD